MAEPAFQIHPARTADDLQAVAELFDAYLDSLGIDLAFQDFAAERATLPGKYAAPTGELLLARRSDGVPLGCVALRSIAPDGCCEMKRLYVSPRARGTGLGAALTEHIIAAAERIDYREMRLDTLPTMAAAIALYTKSGFAPIPPYYETPIVGTIFLGRPLGGGRAAEAATDG